MCDFLFWRSRIVDEPSANQEAGQLIKGQRSAGTCWKERRQVAEAASDVPEESRSAARSRLFCHEETGEQLWWAR